MLAEIKKLLKETVLNIDKDTAFETLNRDFINTGEKGSSLGRS